MSSLSTRFLNTGQDGDIVSLSLGEMIQKQAELRENHEFNGEVVKQKRQINHRDHFNMWDVKNIVEVSKQWHEISKQSDLGLLDKPADAPTPDGDAPNFTEASADAPAAPAPTTDGTDAPPENIELDADGNAIASAPEDTGPPMITVDEADAQAQARYDEGLGEGKQQGETAVRTELAEQFTAIASLMNSLQAVDAVEMGHFRADLEQSVKNIIFDLIAVKIDEFPEIIAERITQSLDKFTEDINGIHLTLNPADWDLLQNDNDFMAQIDGLAIRTTERIKRGGCVLKSDNMEINATLEHQMQIGDDFGKTPSNKKVAEAHKMVADMVDDTPEMQSDEPPADAPQDMHHDDTDMDENPAMDMMDGDMVDEDMADTSENQPADNISDETVGDTANDAIEPIDFDDNTDAHAGNSNHIGLDDEPTPTAGDAIENNMALNAMTGEMEEIPEGTLDLSQGFPSADDVPSVDDVPQVDDNYEDEMVEEDPFAMEESMGEVDQDNENPPEEDNEES